jgi:hypothetical protein
MKPLSFPVILVATSLLSGLACAPALAQTATAPYELSVFASIRWMGQSNIPTR